MKYYTPLNTEYAYERQGVWAEEDGGDEPGEEESKGEGEGWDTDEDEEEEPSEQE